MKTLLTLTLACSLMLLSGCQSAYYGAMEKVGYHKRDIMVDRVKDAKESQEEAQKQFNSALEEMQALLGHSGGDLERAYSKAKDEYDASLEAAEQVSSRIDKVEDVAEALFEEWQNEIGEISSANLRSKSQAKLRETKRSYETMVRSMRRAESKMPPVLTAMKDNMLYLKHNLNAQTLGAIKGEFGNLKRDITGLIKEMKKSIAESNKFIAAMEAGE
ncbi:DUF2959 domain-containing protein [Shewanella cyperi]|uniref:DUF2959 domain-containing protein n=1 Tax=Shewanella cyperi TaxID=2814292 RepID=UPI001A93E167|nr:DUF2959 domain-containing protein [Shewanella cyperi]QSX40673.1 DUF2959 domain-containing protein [Shewanella cyperi]